MANRLISEQSPYLLQHAHNPVDWYPWGDEAFAKAASACKPVIVSIGYAACHWCHVMEHESFENDSVAAFMNEHFVCIKVDREEHPDVDHMYMDAVQAIGGSGGWPLNVFVTPQRAPFYGGTYYPPVPVFNRPSWMQVLQRMTDIWQNQNEEATLQAEQMLQHLKQASLQAATGKTEAWNKNSCRKITDNLLQQADKEKGGFGNAPKFPGTMVLTYLLEHYHFTGYEPALNHALHSLDSMIAGGINDQVAGGFARYATDRDWLIPHFEKMLYDNALIVSVLCDAFQITGNSKYKESIEATLTFIERELKDESGGYYCALDADSEGEEGKFYTWTWEQWDAVFGENNEMLRQYFGVTKEGNWEGTNILHIARSVEDTIASFDCSADELKKNIADAKSKLLEIRSKRVRPGTDDKCLLSWNALMNIALSKSGTVLDNEQYIFRAVEHMEWMERIFTVNGRLHHTWKKGEAKIPAMLDDYAYLIQAMLQLASASGNNKWIIKAAELISTVIEEFSDGETFFYYTSSMQDHLPVRKIDVYDGATPSANAVMADNLWLCGICTERGAWVLRANKMMQNNSDRTIRHSYSFGYWAFLLQRHSEGMKTLVCTGPGAIESCRSFQKIYNPQVFMLTLEKEIFKMPLFEKKFFADKLHIFVCTEQACLPPVHSVAAAISLLES